MEVGVELWRTRRLLGDLSEMQGNGTSMITLMVPPRDQVARVQKLLVEEMGAAANIKSRTNRQSVQGAIKSAQQRLKLYSKVPPRGLAIFVGTIALGGNKDRMIAVSFEPAKPLSRFAYLCDKRFHTELLDFLLEESETNVDLPKKHGRGGQSALRFDRLRTGCRHNYLVQASEAAVKHFIDPSSSQANVAGLILAGSADLKTELEPLLDPRLRAKVLKVVTISHGGERGFNQAIELSEDVLASVKFVQEKKLLGEFFEEVGVCSNKHVSGIRDTLQALEMGAVKSLIVYEDLETRRYVYDDPQTGNKVTKVLSKEEAKEEVPRNREVEEKALVEWLAEEYKGFGCELHIITNHTEEGSSFCSGYGGIGGILRYPLDFAAMNEEGDEA
ncbi:hypothetical protein SELMODRAFT_416122 [Selaginella moellendorffii]|uniref:eRF1/Pelota-like N-terminal domain-containing protein n=1 Tax=Selaginella moellendorffii TaxID=88036 RepID=D8RY56_SELML|nr:hypothetical protein SELMODRAFT_416122 [Selaginella moellendorffii]